MVRRRGGLGEDRVSRLRLVVKRYFDIPYGVFDILLQMRGAIDPDSGQIICHFYSLGVVAIDTPKGAVPFAVAEGCLFITFGLQNVKLVLEHGDAVEVENLSIKHGKIMIGDIEIDHYWGLAALAFAREYGHQVKLYKLRLNIDEEEAPIAGILVEETDVGPALLLIPRTCEYVEEQEQPPTHM